jgi:hypothetical protein
MYCGRFPLEGGVASLGLQQCRLHDSLRIVAGNLRLIGDRLAAQVSDEVAIAEFTEDRQPCSEKV